DIVTDSMQSVISISEYRRAKQMEYNEKHGITPQTVRRAVQESLHTILRGREIASSVINEAGGNFDLTELLRELEDEMQRASANLEFERAALLREPSPCVSHRHRQWGCFHPSFSARSCRSKKWKLSRLLDADLLRMFASSPC